MSQIPASILNQRFVSALDTPEGKTKVAQAGQRWIRDQLREDRYTSQILPLEPVSVNDYQVSTRHDTPVVIVGIEPQSRAMSMTFRGEPKARLISAPRVEVPFYTVSSELFHKTEEELLVYQKLGQPVTKIIEDNTIKDIQAIEDRNFTIHIESCVQALQTEANGGSVTTLNASAIDGGSVVEYSVRKGELARAAAADNETVLPVQRIDFVELFKMLDGRRLRTGIFLITEPDWDSVLAWTTEDMGSPLQSETARDGWSHNLMLGRKYVRTTKTEILRPGNIYAFTDPEYLGKFFRLTDTKFYIDKIARTIKWQAWENIGMVLANVSSVVKMELYSGDATTQNADTILSTVSPEGEEDLNSVNHRVADGLYYPTTKLY
jgi:hypothetical protein